MWFGPPSSPTIDIVIDMKPFPPWEHDDYEDAAPCTPPHQRGRGKTPLERAYTQLKQLESANMNWMALVLGDVTLVLDPVLAKAKAALRDAKALLYAMYTDKSTGGWRFFRNLREGNVLRRLKEAISSMLVAAGCRATVKAAVEAQQRRSGEESRAIKSAPMQPLGQRDLNRGETGSPPREKGQEGARRRKTGKKARKAAKEAARIENTKGPRNASGSVPRPRAASLR